MKKIPPDWVSTKFQKIGSYFSNAPCFAYKNANRLCYVKNDYTLKCPNAYFILSNNEDFDIQQFLQKVFIDASTAMERRFAFYSTIYDEVVPAHVNLSADNDRIIIEVIASYMQSAIRASNSIIGIIKVKSAIPYVDDMGNLIDTMGYSYSHWKFYLVGSKDLTPAIFLFKEGNCNTSRYPRGLIYKGKNIFQLMEEHECVIPKLHVF